MFKKLGIIFAAIFMVASLSACEMQKVTAGNVGVKVNLLGSDKGVSSEEVGPGRYWLTWNEDMYIFPTFTQNYVWTANVAEGSRNNESIDFSTIEGMKVNADIGISYAIDPDKVSVVFQKYRRGVDEITDTYLRNMVRDALVTEASTLEVEAVYGVGKTALMDSVEERVRAEVADIGINIEKIYWIGSLRLPTQVTTALDAKIAATQQAQRKQNEVVSARADADKAIETARGEAESLLLTAKAEAESISIKGKALRNNPQVIQLRSIEKWDGVLPRITGGGAIPFVNVDTSK